MTLSFSQFITYNPDHSLFVSLDKGSSSCLRNLPYVYCVLFSDACRHNSRLFLAAFRNISIIMFRAAMVFGEEVNLHQGHGALFQTHNLSLHHLHDLQRV